MEAIGLASIGTSAASNVLGGILGAKARLDQGEFEAKQLEYNARMARLQSDDALNLGERQASQVRVNERQTEGTQRVGFASQGVQVGVGSPGAIAADTAFQAGQDIITSKANAYRKAWGYSQDANESDMMASRARTSARNEASSTLLTGWLLGADSVMSGAYQWKTPGV